MTYPILQWKEENIETNLKELVDYAIAYATRSRDYYRYSAKNKKWWAKFLRVIAIISGALGGLLPILSQIFADSTFKVDAAWATVAISVAITSIGLDRFFGFSSAWMRFITTEIKVDSKIEQFQLTIENEKFSWGGVPPAFEKAKTMLVLTVSFINEISDIVKDETNTWMVEFQNVIQKFNEDANVKAEASKLGGINVTIEGGERFTEGITIELEGHNAVNFKGTSYSFNNLYPKIYKLSVKGFLPGENDAETVKRQLQSDTLVNVTSGNIVTASIKLL